MSIRFRDIQDSDSERMIDIVGACYALYPGCIFDVDAEEPELRKPATLFAADGKTMWVMEHGSQAKPNERGQMIGCGGLKIDLENRKGEVVKVYLDPEYHGQGLGRTLCGHLIKQAADLHLSELFLWTDSRFTAAHGLYESFGFVRQPETRELQDLSDTTEYLYRLSMETSYA